MKAVFINVILLASLLVCKGQAFECKYPFRMEIETNGSYQISKLKKDTVNVIERKGSNYAFLNVRLSDCKGEVQIEGLTKKGSVVFSGNYKVENHVITDTVRTIDPFSIEFNEVEEIRTYKKLIKQGIWQHWDIYGTLIRIEYWDNGVLQREE